MTDLVLALGCALEPVAPEWIVDPKRVLYRIHRDLRFSPDQRPYKTHVAALSPRGESRRKRGPASIFTSSRPRSSSRAGSTCPTARPCGSCAGYRGPLAGTPGDHPAAGLQEPVRGAAGREPGPPPRGISGRPPRDRPAAPEAMACHPHRAAGARRGAVAPAAPADALCRHAPPGSITQRTAPDRSDNGHGQGICTRTDGVASPGARAGYARLPCSTRRSPFPCRIRAASSRIS
jgi:hypothetical protein